MAKIKIELEIADCNELVSSLRSLVKKIDYVLDNYPPRKPGESERLDTRGKHLTLMATMIEMALYQQTGEKV
jgi:hypothetical protein